MRGTDDWETLLPWEGSGPSESPPATCLSTGIAHRSPLAWPKLYVFFNVGARGECSAAPVLEATRGCRPPG